MAPNTRFSANNRSKAQDQHGLLTPEATPAPEEARVDADKTRQAQEQAKLPAITENPSQDNGLSTQSKPELDVHSDMPTEDESDHEQSVPQPLQVEAVKRVLACRPTEYRKVLAVEPSDPDSRVDEENIVNNFRKLGCQAHPDYNKTPGAEKAFKMVLKAAKQLGVDSDDIREVKYWDGEAELENLRLTSDGKWALAGAPMEVDHADVVPSNFHHEIWEQATPLLGQLCLEPSNTEIISQLNALNDKIIEANRGIGFSEDKLSFFTIDVNSFKTIFESAAPCLARFKKSYNDEEAKLQFHKLNEQLAIFNRQHQYPKGWTLIMPEEAVTKKPQPPTTSPAPASGPNKPGFRRCARKIGLVLDNGTHKKIEGALRAGYGSQLLISHPGENGLTIYELVAASQFGKGFGKSYSENPESTMIELGTAKKLKNEEFSDMAIAGVASVRRLPDNEPQGGWCNEAKTIVLVGFGEDPLDFKWYARTVLGQRFGQKVVDGEINEFRSDAGQERPPPPTTRKQRARAGRNSPAANEEHSGVDDGTKNLKKMMKELENAIARMESQTTRR